MVTVCPSQFATRRTLFHVLVGCGLLMLKVSRLKLPVIWLLVSMRSEERFSRNAETDLVCRLLLEKKKAVALVLISFLPLLEILHSPIVGFVSLAVVLTTLVAGIELPWKIPGAVGSLLIGGGLYYALVAAQRLGYWPDVLALPLEPAAIDPAAGLLPTEWLAAFRFEWIEAFRDSLRYLPIVIPFALATVVGGIDCTESAAAVGDEYDTGQVIAVEALATLLASLCGGVIQTTPYIGHPACKAMGCRAAYVLATALFVGSAGVLGYFGYLYLIIPKVTVYPILIFIGLEIAAQSFHATPVRHYPAVVFACVPALAQLALILPMKSSTRHSIPIRRLVSFSPKALQPSC